MYLTEKTYKQNYLGETFQVPDLNNDIHYRFGKMKFSSVGITVIVNWYQRQTTLYKLDQIEENLSNGTWVVDTNDLKDSQRKLLNRIVRGEIRVHWSEYTNTSLVRMIKEIVTRNGYYNNERKMLNAILEFINSDNEQ